MSGGYLDPQDDGDHQVVIFTFAGSLDADRQVKDWNDFVKGIKRDWGNNPTDVPGVVVPKVTAVTIKGQRTPLSLRPRTPER